MTEAPNEAELLAEIDRLKTQLAEAQLRARQAQDLGQALKWNSLGTFTWDFTTGIIDQDFTVPIEGQPRGALESLGFTPPVAIEDFVNHFADNHVHPAYRYWYKNNLNPTYVQNLTEDGPCMVAFESRLLTEPPAPQYVRYAIPVLKDPQSGHLIGQGTIYDVTNRYRVLAPVEYKEVNRARNALTAALQQVVFLTYYVDVEHDTFEDFISTDAIRGTVSLMNPLPTARELIQFISRFVHQDFQPAFLELFDLDTLDARIAGQCCLTEEMQLKDSSWMRATCIPSSTDKDGKITSIVVAVQNVTEDRRIRDDLSRALESADLANAAKTNFLFSMSHDIRTPMNAVLGYSRLLRKGLTSPTQIGYLDRMDQAGEILMSLINNVLDMARIESGHVQVENSYLRTGNVVDGIVNVFSQIAAEKNIQLVHTIDVSHPDIMCDIVKTREILTNLVSNAIKYTQPGGTVTIATRELPSGHPGIVVIETKVSDTGIGMSPEFLPHLFDEFTREKIVVDHQIEGTGLGMPIVKKLVDLMGGTIEVESQLGVGTTFTVTMCHESAKKPGAQEEQESVDTCCFVGKRILLAEDNDLNAEIAQVILTDLGFFVERAIDGQECVDMLVASEPGYYDLVLMDVQMPRMNGYEASRAIRLIPDPTKGDIPIVAMTANAFSEDKANAKAAGMNAHLAKPIEMDKLIHTLAQLT